MKTPQHRFEVRPLSQEDGGGWLVTFPDLPGCMADGETVEEAVSEAADAEQSWLKTHEELDLPVPSGRFMVRIPKTLHTKLSARAKQEGVSMNTLAVAYLSEGMAKEG
jgi:antitoxin HicB